MNYCLDLDFKLVFLYACLYLNENVLLLLFGTAWSQIIQLSILAYILKTLLGKLSTNNLNLSLLL